MKKKISLIILIIIITMAQLCACTAEKEEKKQVMQETERFILVEGDPNYRYREFIFADQETGVLYLAMIGNHKFGITALLNADGTPMLMNQQEEE